MQDMSQWYNVCHQTNVKHIQKNTTQQKNTHKKKTKKKKQKKTIEKYESYNRICITKSPTALPTHEPTQPSLFIHFFSNIFCFFVPKKRCQIFFTYVKQARKHTHTPANIQTKTLTLFCSIEKQYK